jgi:hypothetical protein
MHVDGVTSGNAATNCADLVDGVTSGNVASNCDDRVDGVTSLIVASDCADLVEGTAVATPAEKKQCGPCGGKGCLFCRKGPSSRTVLSVDEVYTDFVMKAISVDADLATREQLCSELKQALNKMTQQELVATHNQLNSM